MKKYITIILCLFSFHLFAQDSLSKEHVLSMLEEMKKEGIVPAHEAPAVEAKIRAMSDSQFGQIKEVARGIAAKNPSMKQNVAPTLESAAANVDTHSKEFEEATKKLEKIMK